MAGAAARRSRGGRWRTGSTCRRQRRKQGLSLDGGVPAIFVGGEQRGQVVVVVGGDRLSHLRRGTLAHQTTLGEMPLRVGQPYGFIHQGDVEHIWSESRRRRACHFRWRRATGSGRRRRWRRQVEPVRHRIEANPTCVGGRWRIRPLWARCRCASGNRTGSYIRSSALQEKKNQTCQFFGTREEQSGREHTGSRQRNAGASDHSGRDAVARRATVRVHTSGRRRAHLVR
jgi:hypothetical protein